MCGKSRQTTPSKKGGKMQIHREAVCAGTTFVSTAQEWPVERLTRRRAVTIVTCLTVSASRHADGYSCLRGRRRRANTRQCVTPALPPILWRPACARPNAVNDDLNTTTMTCPESPSMQSLQACLSGQSRSGLFVRLQPSEDFRHRVEDHS